MSIARCNAYEADALMARPGAVIDQLGLQRLLAGKTVAVKVNLTGDVEMPSRYGSST